MEAKRKMKLKKALNNNIKCPKCKSENCFVFADFICNIKENNVAKISCEDCSWSAWEIFGRKGKL